MVRKPDQHQIVGLDIGTSKVVAIVGEVSMEGELEIAGIGSHASRGLKKGVVVNIESTVQSIQRAHQAWLPGSARPFRHGAQSELPLAPTVRRGYRNPVHA